MADEIVDLRTDLADAQDIIHWNNAQLQSTKLQLRIANEEIDNLHFQLNLSRWIRHEETPILEESETETEPDEQEEEELPATSTFGGF